jgi:hypothetical protein
MRRWAAWWFVATPAGAALPPEPVATLDLEVRGVRDCDGRQFAEVVVTNTSARPLWLLTSADPTIHGRSSLVTLDQRLEVELEASFLMSGTFESDHPWLLRGPLTPLASLATWSGTVEAEIFDSWPDGATRTLELSAVVVVRWTEDGPNVPVSVTDQARLVHHALSPICGVAEPVTP